MSDIAIECLVCKKQWQDDKDACDCDTNPWQRHKWMKHGGNECDCGDSIPRPPIWRILAGLLTVVVCFGVIAICVVFPALMFFALALMFTTGAAVLFYAVGIGLYERWFE